MASREEVIKELVELLEKEGGFEITIRKFTTKPSAASKGAGDGASLSLEIIRKEEEEKKKTCCPETHGVANLIFNATTLIVLVIAILYGFQQRSAWGGPDK